jgi:hypothetical protein
MNERILIIEDDQAILKLLQPVQEGYTAIQLWMVAT